MPLLLLLQQEYHLAATANTIEAQPRGTIAADAIDGDRSLNTCEVRLEASPVAVDISWTGRRVFFAEESDYRTTEESEEEEEITGIEDELVEMIYQNSSPLLQQLQKQQQQMMGNDIDNSSHHDSSFTKEDAVTEESSSPEDYEIIEKTVFQYNNWSTE